jgi:hypothetical protein
MTVYRNKYLEMLRAEKLEKGPAEELTKLTKGGFVSFGSNQLKPFPKISPPLDAEGVPCGGWWQRRVLALGQVPPAAQFPRLDLVVLRTAAGGERPLRLLRGAGSDI